MSKSSKQGVKISRRRQAGFDKWKRTRGPFEVVVVFDRRWNGWKWKLYFRDQQVGDDKGGSDLSNCKYVATYSMNKAYSKYYQQKFERW